MGINMSLNPHQELSARQRRDRKLRLMYCPHCQRYGWAERIGDRYRCLECGNIVEEENARNSNINSK